MPGSTSGKRMTEREVRKSSCWGGAGKPERNSPLFLEGRGWRGRGRGGRHQAGCVGRGIASGHRASGGRVRREMQVGTRQQASCGSKTPNPNATLE